jgi:TldD protein
MKELADVALNAAKMGGAEYADIRISRHKSQEIYTREDRVQRVADSESYGFGVRVLVGGTWGFAASHQVAQPSIAQATRRALAMARANQSGQRQPVILPKVPAVVAQWRTPIQVDPFTVPIDRKVGLLLEVNAAALKVKGAKYCNSWMLFRNEEKLFASTDGSVIEQSLCRSWPCFTVTAIDVDKGTFETRTAEIPPTAMGYAYVEFSDLVLHAPRIAEEAVRKLTAKSVEPGRRDIILHPSNLWLTIHESIGHSTELDRVLGYEANYAGTSFLTPDNLGKLKLGSDLVNFKADRTVGTGLATCAYDDDGVKTTEWHLVKDGLFVDYQTVRQQVNWPEYRAARKAAGLPVPEQGYACAYGDSWGSIPFQRQANIHLEPGRQRLTLEELIADTQDGIYIIGDSSFSIDQQRRNFQFSGQVFFEIKDGKFAGMLKDVAYQSNTAEFWNSCDAICDERFWELHGTYYCGKGQPPQSAPVSHGSAPARFRNVNILNTRRTV